MTGLKDFMQEVDKKLYEEALEPSVLTKEGWKKLRKEIVEEISNCCGWSMTNDFCNKCNDPCSPLTEEELEANIITSKPDVLTHPNIPKPLHGVNPRSIMGKDKWDTVRKKVYAEANYCCVACGVPKSKAKKHQWLEAHEYYNVNYKKGVVEIKMLVALCHYCHNFIHSGRLAMIVGKEKTEDEIIEILGHGFKILSDNKLKAFPFTLEFAEQLRVHTYGVKPYKLDHSKVAWEDWRLVWEGKEYPPKYKTFKEWKERYNERTS